MNGDAGGDDDDVNSGADDVDDLEDVVMRRSK